MKFACDNWSHQMTYKIYFSFSYKLLKSKISNMKLSLNSFQNTHDWLKTQNDHKHWQGIRS